MKSKMIITGGVLLIVLALFHLSFWHLFNWQEELPKLNAVNSGIMQMSAVGFVCLFLSLGIIFICFRKEVANTRLGKALSLALAFFSLVRTISEFIFPGSSIELGIFLFICTLIFFVPALMKK